MRPNRLFNLCYGTNAVAFVMPYCHASPGEAFEDPADWGAS